MSFKRVCALLLAVCLITALAIPAFAVGPFNDVPTEIRMSANATKTDDNKYSVSLIARMNMADSLAKAAILGADVSVLDRVRFVCTLTLSDDIDVDWSTVSVEENAYSVSGYGSSFTYNRNSYKVYDFVSIERNGNNIIMTYKLTDECKKHIRYLGVDGAIAALRKEVVFSCFLDNANVSFGDVRTVYSEVDVTGYKGKIVAALGSTKLLVDEPEPEGEYIEKTVDAKVGEIVEVVIDPAPGKKVTNIAVIKDDGTEIEHEYTGNGNFNFVKPEGEYEIIIEYDDAPYTPDDSGVGILLNVDDHVPYVHGYETGLFLPKNNVRRCEVALMFYRLLRNPEIEITATFSDLDDSSWWYEKEVRTLATLSILNGYPDGTYRPFDPMTRAEFAAACVRFATIEPHKKDNVFADVNSTYWAYDAIQKAAAYGWIVGYNGNFDPDRNVSRSEACAIINRMLARPADGESLGEGNGIHYPDVIDGVSWAYNDITEASTDHDTDVDYVKYTEDWTKIYGGLYIKNNT